MYPLFCIICKNSKRCVQQNVCENVWLGWAGLNLLVMILLERLS